MSLPAPYFIRCAGCRSLLAPRTHSRPRSDNHQSAQCTRPTRRASVASRAGLARFALLHRPSHVIAEHRAPWPRCSHADGRPPLRPSHHVRLPKRLDALANQQHAGGRRYRWIALDAESCWIAHVTHTHAKNAPRSDPELPRGLHTQHPVALLAFLTPALLTRS